MLRFFDFRFPRLLPFGLTTLLWVGPAEGIVTPTSSPVHLSESGLQRAVRDAFGTVPTFPYWNYIGCVNHSTGIYIGAGRVLTAAHVGIGTFVTRDGRSYLPVAGSATRFRNRQGGHTDLFVYRIEVANSDPLGMLPPMSLSKACPDRGATVVLLGAGGGNAGNRLAANGFRWNEDFRLRWGLNAVAAKFVRPILTYEFATPGFATHFANGKGESQACPGDSGGGVFVFNREGNRWELGGVILAVDGKHGTASFGDQTYIGDLSLLPRKEFGPGGMLAAH
ncbi:MAG: hypothetical protein DVB23_000873 [Verrucomicrobia bacterium]|jgi:hypothetical protein|nr:MAG: hypothetical protein DVB23_000873 [Verrucomicrobiota bacterium]